MKRMLIVIVIAACGGGARDRALGGPDAGSPPPDDAGTSCSAGQQLCSGQCVPLGDPGNCGACGVTCPPTLACIDGSCGCPSGTAQCGNACVDEQADPGNCGACGNACASDSFCQSGSCVVQCPSNMKRCTSPVMEYCADVLNDPANCGACGNICPQKETDGGSGINPAQVCCSGTCTVLGTDANCSACGDACLLNDTCEDFVGILFCGTST